MTPTALGRPGARALGAALLLLAAGPLERLRAQASPSGTTQVTLHISAGARYSSTLVRDSIVTPLTVRPAIAPALAVAAVLPLEHRWSAETAVDFSWSALQRHDAGGSTLDLGTVSVLAFQVGLRRALAAGLAAQVGVGALKYLPAEDAGVFSRGGGPLFALGSAAVSYEPRFGSRFGLGLEARYDLHRFNTPALRDAGFTTARTVYRVALAVRAAPLPRAPR